MSNKKNINPRTNSVYKILLAEDDEDIADLLKSYLQFVGFEVKVVNNGKKALEEAHTNRYDIALFDIMMPILEGTKVLRYMRDANINLPVIFITAKDAVSNKIEGLAQGADDYITKPFDLEEVVARIRTVLRRFENSDSVPDFSDIVDGKIIVNGDLKINTDTLDVTRDEKLISLTPNEFKILKYLIENADVVCSKFDIADILFGDNFNDDVSLIETYISTLRKKLGKPNIIETKRGAGYLIREQI
jgi:two-component system OmpR family response regulator